MKKIIAIPTENGNLCPHFGHCESFYFASINDKKEITAEKNIVPPTHEPGLYPKWIRSQGGECVIAGGMGEKAKNIFNQENIKVVVGAEIKEPRKLIEEYLNGSLATGANSCNHHH